MERTVKLGDKVTVDYVEATDNGVIIDTSIPAEADFSGDLDMCREYKAITFVVGTRYTFEGFDDALLNMKEGETKTIKVPAAKAYGKKDEKKILQLPPNSIKTHGNIVKGEELMLTQDNKVIPARVIKIDKKGITVDTNHPLAGKDIILTIKLNKIEPGPKQDSKE